MPQLNLPSPLLHPPSIHPRTQALNGFLAKSDGKDKLTALIQYAAMWASAGVPGNARKVQASVAAARKVFRVFRPLESATPVLLDPHFVRGVPVHKQAIAKVWKRGGGERWAQRPPPPPPPLLLHLPTQTRVLLSLSSPTTLFPDPLS